MKKKLIGLLSIFSVLCMGCAVSGCNKGNDGNDGAGSSAPIVAADILLNDTEEDLVLGDVYALRAFSGGEAVVCDEWRSSNPTVATVDEWGNVTAHGVGETVITGTYAADSESCVIRVGLGDYLPWLSMDGVIGDSVQVDVQHAVNLSGTVYFNGIPYADGLLTYSLSDPQLGTIEEGIFFPQAVGQVTVTVTAAWRGIQSKFLSKDITIDVIHNAVMLINGEGIPESVSLYTVDEFDGESYETEWEMHPELKIDGVEKDVTVQIEDVSVATYDEERKTICGLSNGETNVLLSYVDEEIEFVKTIPVKVTAPVGVYREKICDFSALDGELYDGTGNNLVETLFADGVVSAIQGDRKLDVSQKGKILGVQTSSDGLTRTQVTVIGKKYGYTFNVEGYTMILDEEKDLLDAFTFDTSVATLTTKTGYYILKNDIVMTNGGATKHTESINYEQGWATIQKQNFGGVLDGNGFAIDGLHIGNSGGLFGQMTNGGVVKNLAFTNLRTYGWGTYLFGTVLSNATIENVYIQIVLDKTLATNANMYKTNGMGLFGNRSSSNLHVKNVVIEMNDGFPELATGKVGLFNIDGISSRPDFQSVYFVVPQASNGRVLPMYQTTTETVYAANDYTEISEGAKVAFDGTTKNPSASADGTHTLYHYTGIYRFDNYADLTDYTGSSKVGNWTVTDGKLIWKK